MCHRKTLLDDMQSISDQMLSNRQQSISEVVSFIDKQAKDGHEQAKKLIDNAIDRIIKSSENIYTYIENRRSAKVIHLKNKIDFLKEKILLHQF
jgi:glutamyl-tRNA reductase